MRGNTLNATTCKKSSPNEVEITHEYSAVDSSDASRNPNLQHCEAAPSNVNFKKKKIIV
jgi:hypothetical protein